MGDKKTKHLYCHNCKCETDQEIIFNDSTLDINEIIGYNEAGVKGQNCFAIVAHIYEITKCCGCKKTISMYMKEPVLWKRIASFSDILIQKFESNPNG